MEAALGFLVSKSNISAVTLCYTLVVYIPREVVKIQLSQTSTRCNNREEIIMTALNKTTASAKTAKAVKTTKATKATKTTATKPARLPAKEQMALRKRMFFGPAYINGVLGGVQRDFEKMVQHALILKIDQPSKLRKLTLEALREKLADAIMTKENGAAPFSIVLGEGSKPVVKMH